MLGLRGLVLVSLRKIHAGQFRCLSLRRRSKKSYAVYGTRTATCAPTIRRLHLAAGAPATVVAGEGDVGPTAGCPQQHGVSARLVTRAAMAFSRGAATGTRPARTPVLASRATTSSEHIASLTSVQMEEGEVAALPEV